MKKLSNILESTWGDMRKRAEGKQIRREDDVNLLDIRGLCDYLKSKYKASSDNDITVRNFGQNVDYLVICLLADEAGYYRFLYYDGETIDTQLDVFQTLGCLDELKRKYSTHEGKNDVNIECIDIYPKGQREPVTNKFFLEVLDFILDRIDTPLEQQIEKINESTWGDMRKRAEGKQIRIEDDIDLLDFDDFVDYLKNHYRELGKFKINTDMHKSRISVPFVGDDEKSPWCINLEFEINKEGEQYIVTSEMMKEYFPDICSKLGEQFNVEHNHNDGGLYIHPKDNGQITHSFYVEILNFAIDNCGNEDEFIMIERTR